MAPLEPGCCQTQGRDHDGRFARHAVERRCAPRRRAARPPMRCARPMALPSPAICSASGGEKTVVCSMHPREMVVVSYMVPEILKGGCALWIQGPRTVGNDLRLEHETALLDLAAGQSSCAKR